MWIYSIGNECTFFVQLFCFKKCDYLTIICAKKKFIRYSFTATTTPQVPVPKLRKSHKQYRAYLPFALTIAAHPCLTERTSCWIVMSTRCISFWHDRLSRKYEVTECRSRPWVVTRGRSVLSESFVTSLALNLSPSRLYVLHSIKVCIKTGKNASNF